MTDTNKGESSGDEAALQIGSSNALVDDLLVLQVDV